MNKTTIKVNSTSNQFFTVLYKKYGIDYSVARIAYLWNQRNEQLAFEYFDRS